jgi:integrase
MAFAFFTGWRVRSEVLPLTWAQVDEREQIVRLEVGTTKNREGRTFPYGVLPELSKVLTA